MSSKIVGDYNMITQGEISPILSLTLKENGTGFLKNSEIKLPFPPDAQKVKDKAIKLGLDKKVQEFVPTLNRAAEEASKEASKEVSKKTEEKQLPTS